MNQITIGELFQEIFTFYQAGEYDQALALITREAGSFPNHRNRMSYWQACLLAKTDRPDDAVRALTAAVEAGEWWSPVLLQADPDLESIQEDPDFSALLDACAERQAETEARLESLMLVEPPQEGEPPFPLLLVLHGRAGHPQMAMDHWRSAARAGWLVAAPRSSQLLSPDSCSWDDPQRTEQEIVAYLGRLVAEQPVDSQRIVIAGFSQGGAVAIALALTQAVPAAGFLAVAPGARFVPQLETALEKRQSPALRGAIIAGNQDFRYEETLSLVDRLRALDLAIELIEIPELGHAYPPDFEPLLEARLKSLDQI